MHASYGTKGSTPNQACSAGAVLSAGESSSLLCGL